MLGPQSKSPQLATAASAQQGRLAGDLATSHVAPRTPDPGGAPSAPSTGSIF